LGPWSEALWRLSLRRIRRLLAITLRPALVLVLPVAARRSRRHAGDPARRLSARRSIAEAAWRDRAVGQLRRAHPDDGIVRDLLDVRWRRRPV